MTIKKTLPLVVANGTDEQSNASSRTITTSSFSREYREPGSFQRMILFLNVTAVSGTGTFIAALQIQDPVSLAWQDTSAIFPSQTAITGGTPITALTVELYGICYRMRYTITGFTSVTFSCVGIMNTEEPALV